VFTGDRASDTTGGFANGGLPTYLAVQLVFGFRGTFSVQPSTITRFAEVSTALPARLGSGLGLQRHYGILHNTMDIYAN
jgi:hypothetical protein